ncbi:MAG: hypothetical protein OEP52_09575, partial [Acidimicrobiia bacterium]|nr:hypothetical protein [Acidimicrobiia bacterium]
MRISVRVGGVEINPVLVAALERGGVKDVAPRRVSGRVEVVYVGVGISGAALAATDRVGIVGAVAGPATAAALALTLTLALALALPLP